MYNMSTSNFTRIAGLGAILAGAYRLIQVIVEFSSNGAGIFDGKAWDYLTVLAATLILVLTLALYRQGDGHVNGLIILGIGSALLILSAILYAVDFDPEDGAAFMSFFLGTVLQGVGVAVLGNRYRSQVGATGWGLVLMILGTILVLAFPVSAVIFGGQELSDQLAGIIWVSVIALQAVTWMILGAKVLAGHSETGNIEQGQTA